MVSSVFVWHNGETKKLSLDATPSSLVDVKSFVKAKFADVNFDDNDTVLYVDNADRPDVSYELEQISDIKEGSRISVRSRKQLAAAVRPPATSQPPLSNPPQPATVATAAATVAARANPQQQQAPAEELARSNTQHMHGSHAPVLLPGGKVQIGHVV